MMRARLLFLGVCLACMLNAVARDEPDGSVAPLPAAASAELRRAIENWPRPNAVAMEPPATDAEWVSRIQQAEERGLSTVQAMLVEFPVKVVSDRISEIEVYWVKPLKVAKKNKHRVFLHLHGGAYVFGGGQGSISEAILIASRIGIPVLSIAPLKEVMLIYGWAAIKTVWPHCEVNRLKERGLPRIVVAD